MRKTTYRRRNYVNFLHATILLRKLYSVLAYFSVIFFRGSIFSDLLDQERNNVCTRETTAVLVTIDTYLIEMEEQDVTMKRSDVVQRQQLRFSSFLSFPCLPFSLSFSRASFSFLCGARSIEKRVAVSGTPLPH